jgi:uncharacterized membrane protein HdeD (DUF308 family)
MTKIQRISKMAAGIVIVLISAVLIFFPSSNLAFVAHVLSLSMTIRGFQALWYYFRMARHMVGGLQILFQAIVFLDLGIFTSALTDSPILYIMIYLMLLHFFRGLIGVLRGRESKITGSPSWKFEFMNGVFNIGLVVILTSCGFMFNSESVVVIVYGIGLMYAGISRIVSAFKRTSIVYVQ